MTDAALPSCRIAPAPKTRDDTAPPRPRPRGPVLIGDLHAGFGGRPLLLMHWDRSEDEP